MKRLLSVLCALAIVLGVAVLPTAVNADSPVELNPTCLHNVTKTEEGGADVYTAGTWNAGSITFDYKIESGYRYFLAFDYMGKSTADAQAPMASTVATDSTKLNDEVAKAVALNLPTSTTEFKPVWIEISGEDLLASGGEYLAINWKHLTTEAKFKSFKIFKTTVDETVPKATYLHRFTGGVENGEIVYTGSTWTACSLTFDYEIKSGYSYFLSFDFTGHNYFETQKLRASTVATPTTNLNAKITTGTEVPLPSNQTTWYNVSVELKSEDLLSSGGKYLALNFIHAGNVNKFKNFKIQAVKMVDDGYIHPVTLKKGEINKSIENDEIIYAMKAWASPSMVFDYELEAGKEYVLQFEYMGHNYAETTVPSIMAAPDLSFQVSGAKPQYTVSLNLTSTKTEYKKFEVTFNADSVITGGGKYFTVFAQNLSQTGYFKNFKLQKVEVNNDGYIFPVTLKKNEVTKSIVDGDIIYTMKAWACPSMVFNYELKAGKEYVFEFEYRGHNWAQNCVPSIMAATSLDFQTNASLPEYRLSLGVPSTTTEFTKCTVVFEADSLIAGGGKYFTIFAQNLGSVSEFKNMKLSLNTESELVGEQPLTVSKVKGGDEVVTTVEKGETVYNFAKAWCTPSITFNFRMKPGKTYAVNFDYILTCGFAGNSYLEPSFTAVENASAMGSRVYENSVSAGLKNANEWTNKTTIINADDIITETQRFLMFYCVNPTSANGVKVKNFTIAEIDPNELLSNGGFESGMTFWKNADGTATLTETTVEDGKYAVNLKGGNYSILSHTVALQPNKNYKLSFKYRGKFSGLPNWAIAKGTATMDVNTLLHYGKLTSTEEWKEHSVVFSSGEDNAFAIMFQTGASCDFYIDSVVLEETTEKAAEKFVGKIPVYTENEAANRFWHWDADTEEHNLVKNGNFDGEGGNWDSLLADGTFSVVTSDEAKSGDKMLKFEAQGLSELSYNYLYVDCKPNTEYMLSVWHKGENWSDTNKNDLRWSIADPITGKMLFTVRTNLRGYNLNAWDNEWHRSTLKFNSGNNDVIALVYQGANSVAYVDDLQIFEYANRKNARPFVMVQKQPTVTNYLGVNDKIACDAEDNLFENFTFEKKNISFWNGEDSLGYAGTVSEKYVTVLDWDGTAVIADSESSHGKALYYEEQTKYTGQPLSTSYIKYIDVESDTEYTFAADFRVDKEGGGRFGLLSVNDFWPRIIGEWKTFKDENYDPDHNWQTYAFSFNSNEFDRVAFMLQDKGGEAFIDNIRLFKTVNGKTQENIVYKVESNKYDIVNGMFEVSKGNTVGAVLNTIKNKSEIVVFDKDGNEVNDMNRIVETGMQFKYMDGISALDTATAIVYGDVNCDGKIDKEDTKALLRHILGVEVLFDIGVKAGDMNGDGVIDIIDVSLATGKKASDVSDVTATFEGPQEVAANNEFEVVYYLNGKGISAADGVINYNPENLTFVSLDAEIGSDWVVQHIEEDGKIKFAVADGSGKKALNDKTAMFTVTFKANDVSGAFSELSVTNQVASAGKKLVKINDIGYTGVSEKQEDNNVNNQIGNDDFVQDNTPNDSIIITDKEDGPSNNNRLASLIVKNATITPEFDPEIKNYEATVPFEIEELIVEAVTADEKATVEISDTKLIYVGKNITKIVVHSESGLKRTYKIYTTREAPEKNSNGVANVNNGLPLWGWILIGAGAVAVVAVGIIILIIFKKRKGDKK